MKHVSSKDRLFLNSLEEIMLTLKHHYKVKDFDSLERKILKEAKKNAEDMETQKKMEFISLVKQVLDAYEFAHEKHKDQQRVSGEPYIMHPLHVALNEIFHQRHLKKDYRQSAIIASILHDTVEDTDTSYTEINKRFGTHMADLVSYLTNKPMWSEWKKQGLLSSTEKAALQFLQARKDDASLSVKFQDRLHNLETIRHLPPKKRFQKILDTIQVGFVEHARQEKMTFFLLQLYISVHMYLSDESIEEFAEDPKQARRIRDKALHEIKKALSKQGPHLFEQAAVS